MTTLREKRQLTTLMPAPVVTITPLRQRMTVLRIEGESPLVICRFAEKAIQQIKLKHETGSKNAKISRARDPRDFAADYEAAKHISAEGWCGIHAAAFRNGAIDACRAAGFVMTKAKLGLFIEPDGFDVVDGAPLVRILDGEPEMWIATTRNETGVTDLRARPMWRTWSAEVTIRYDEDMFTQADVVNLLYRVGQQVGIGEGRPFSKRSNGLGFGTFRLVTK